MKYEVEAAPEKGAHSGGSGGRRVVSRLESEEASIAEIPGEVYLVASGVFEVHGHEMSEIYFVLVWRFSPGILLCRTRQSWV